MKIGFSHSQRPATVWSFVLVCLLMASVSNVLAETASKRQTENVIVVTFDGLRCLEVFDGADSRLLNRNYGGIKDVAQIKSRYNAEDGKERREKLLPFLWNSVIKQGQIFGDVSQACPATLANKYGFSAPGYSEMFSGFPDDQIDSNDKIPNPNQNVLGWLNNRPGFEGRVAAIASWDVFPFILSSQRNHLMVNAGWEGSLGSTDSKQTKLLVDLAHGIPHYYPTVRFDAFTFYAALNYLQEEKPRVLFVSFAETDDWGHAGRYDLLLDAAHHCDRFIRQIWEKAQSIPQYAGKTTLLITTDHGRGVTPSDWKDHGTKYSGSERIWIAALGPDTPAKGICRDEEVTLSQLAATIAALLGEDYNKQEPQAAPSLPVVVVAP